MNWFFALEMPLPAGLELAVLATAAAELGSNRLAEAESLLGREAAREVAKKAGPYELDEGLARRLELEGLKLGAGGELPALSPTRWGLPAEAETWAQLNRRLAEKGGEIRGVQLSAAQRGAFLQFLSRNRVNVDGTALEMVELARHFFFGEPINVVVRYTGPVSANS
jgi:hypothetical protein